MKRALVFLIALTFVSCGRPQEPAIRAGAQNATTPTGQMTASPQPLDGLTIELELASTTVPSGGVLRTFLNIKNDSGERITDPECWLGAGRFGLIPADDPEAKLWQAIIVDCGGTFHMNDGFTDRWDGPGIRATNMHGVPLPPGDYLAALEIEGFSERLTQPVEIVE